MDPVWTPQEVLESVRRHLATWHFERPLRIDRVDLAEGDLLVVFGGLHADVLNGVRFSLAHLPTGPLTDTVCNSVDEWASEVAIALDEASSTREMDGAERRVEPDGVVLLRWWRVDTWTLGAEPH